MGTRDTLGVQGIESSSSRAKGLAGVRGLFCKELV